MLEYILVLLLLFFGALSFFLAWDRFRTKRQQPESSQYVQALIDLLNDKQESAFSKLRQVVAEDSENVDAYLRLGQILRENNRVDRALQVHRDLTLRPGLTAEQKRAVLHQLAEDYLAVDDTDMAEKALKEVISIDNGDRWAHSRLLGLQERAKKWEDAYQTAVQLLRLEGNKSKKPLARYKFQMGEQLYRKREYHKARIIYKEAIGLDPTFVPAYLAIGDSYVEEKRFEDAVNFWNKLISSVPEQGHLVIDRLKKTLFDLGRFGEIFRICENILEHDSSNVQARRTMAEFYEKKGDLQAAIGVLKQIIDDNPQDYLSALELVRLYVEIGETKKVSEVLRSLERRRGGPARPSSRSSEDTSAVGAR